jgi:ketosteroid isomerase-like protein
MLRYYGPDDDVIFYDLGGQLRGREEIRAHFEPIFAAVREIQVGTPASFVDSDGLIGIQISRHHVKIEGKDGSTTIVDLRRSDCLRRVNGKWYSMLSMISLPTARVNWQDPKSIASPTEGATTHPTE